MSALGALLRPAGYVLAFLLLQAAAAVVALSWNLSPWWSLLLLPALLLLRGLWRLAVRASRAMSRHRQQRRQARRRQAPRNAGLTQAWQRALQRSSGARAGLPWFVLLGSPGSGKTSALERARIPSPLSAVRGEAEDAPGFAWWYTDRLVILDFGDALPAADATAETSADWRYHLRMLRRHRRHEGIDGVVLTLDARRLGPVDGDHSGDDARALRARLDELIGELGRRFPVYLLVTHCDALYGFEAWARRLGDDYAHQVLGYLADIDDDATQHDFIRQAFDALGARLQRVRWRMLAEDSAESAELLMFPAELQTLRAPLQAFFDNGLAPHPYLERLLLRGLFFSSGKQQGGAVSRILDPDTAGCAVHAARYRGIFLRGLFADVLPAERGLQRPSAAMRRRRRRNARIALAGWLLLIGVGAAALSVSFSRNLRALEGLHAAELAYAGASSSPDEQIETLVARETAIRRLEHRSRGLLAHLTLSASEWNDLLMRQKRRFVEAARERLHQGTPTADEAPAGAGESASQALSVLHLLRLAQALQAHARGADLRQLRALPHPLATQRDDADGLAETLWQLELAQIAWTAPSDPRQQASLLRTRARLDRLALQDPQLRWLARVPALQGVAALRAADAWDALAPQDDDAQQRRAAMATLAPEFTAAGDADMREVVAQWRAVSAEPGRVDAAWAQFHGLWVRQQQAAARTAIEQSLATPPPLRDAAQWRAALPALAGADNPYWKFACDVLRQLAPTDGGADDSLPGTTGPAAADTGDAQAPPWLHAAREFAAWHAELGSGPMGRSVLDALRSAGTRVLNQGTDADPADAARAVTGRIQGSRELRDYLKALEGLAARLEQGDAQATSVAANFQAFGSDPAVKQSLGHDAANALRALRERLRQASDPSRRCGTGANTAACAVAAFPIDELLGAPWRALMQYADAAAACSLQRRWQSDVLWPLQTAVSRDDMLQQVYGPRGTLWAFVDGPAAAFLHRDAQRYRPAEKQGQAVAFTPEFLGMLNGAALRRADQRRQQAQDRQTQLSLQTTQQQLVQADKALQSAQLGHAVVSVSALPSDVQPETAPRVVSTTLSMECASGTTRLDNFNLPQQRSLEWSAQNCSGVRLRIVLGDLVLERRYPGPLGLPDFLAEFRSGSHAFTPEDFPVQAAALRRLGVRRIVLHYGFDGADAALRAAGQLRQARQRAQELERTLQQLQERLGNVPQAPAPSGSAASSAAAASATAPYAADPLQDAALAALGLPPRIAVCWTQAPAPAAAGTGP